MARRTRQARRARCRTTEGDDDDDDDDGDDGGGDDDDGGLWVSDDVGAGAVRRSSAAQPTAPRSRYSPRLSTSAKTCKRTLAQAARVSAFGAPTKGRAATNPAAPLTCWPGVPSGGA